MNPQSVSSRRRGSLGSRSGSPPIGTRPITAGTYHHGLRRGGSPGNAFAGGIRITPKSASPRVCAAAMSRSRSGERKVRPRDSSNAVNIVGRGRGRRIRSPSHKSGEIMPLDIRRSPKARTPSGGLYNVGSSGRSVMVPNARERAGVYPMDDQDHAPGRRCVSPIKIEPHKAPRQKNVEDTGGDMMQSRHYASAVVRHFKTNRDVRERIFPREYSSMRSKESASRVAPYWGSASGRPSGENTDERRTRPFGDHLHDQGGQANRRRYSSSSPHRSTPLVESVAIEGQPLTRPGGFGVPHRPDHQDGLASYSSIRHSRGELNVVQELRQRARGASPIDMGEDRDLGASRVHHFRPSERGNRSSVTIGSGRRSDSVPMPGAIPGRLPTGPFMKGLADTGAESRLHRMLEMKIEDIAADNHVLRQVMLDQSTRLWKMSQILIRRGIEYVMDADYLLARAESQAEKTTQSPLMKAKSPSTSRGEIMGRISDSEEAFTEKCSYAGEKNDPKNTSAQTTKVSEDSGRDCFRHRNSQNEATFGNVEYGIREANVALVDCHGMGGITSFKSIKTALSCVSKGATILIAEGLYIESLVISQQVRLVGMGTDVQLRSDKGNAVTVRADNVVIQNIHIRSDHYTDLSIVHALGANESGSSQIGSIPTSNHCVSVFAMNCVLDGCDLTTSRGHCVYCDPSIAARRRKETVANTGKVGDTQEVVQHDRQAFPELPIKEESIMSPETNKGDCGASQEENLMNEEDLSAQKQNKDWWMAEEQTEYDEAVETKVEMTDEKLGENGGIEIAATADNSSHEMSSMARPEDDSEDSSSDVVVVEAPAACDSKEESKDDGIDDDQITGLRGAQKNDGIETDQWYSFSELRKKENLITCRSCRIHHASSCGIFVTGRCNILIENCQLEACGMAGIEVRDRARLTILHSRITNCAKSGIFAHGSSHVNVAATDVINCGMAGVEISKQSTGRIYRSRIYHGVKGGVFVHDHAHLVLRDSEIFANSMSNVDVRAKGVVDAVGNKIAESRTSGVYVSAKGEAVLRRNKIMRNLGNGIEMNTGALTCIGNDIHENQRCAIFANGVCSGKISNNDLRWNMDRSLNTHSHGRLPTESSDNMVDDGGKRWPYNTSSRHGGSMRHLDKQSGPMSAKRYEQINSPHYTN